MNRQGEDINYPERNSSLHIALAIDAIFRKIVFFTVQIEPDIWIKPEYSAILDGLVESASKFRGACL